LEQWPEVILMGEDIHAPYGGSFKVTGDLSRRFPARVLATPISEEALAGAALGLALGGWRPVLEIMFADFLTLVMDPLFNHAVKHPALHPDQPLPLVIRAPAGGYRGYGPTHSQSPESLFTAVPGLTVLFPSHRHDVRRLLRNAVTGWDHPVLFLEHKLSYSLTVDPERYRPLEPRGPDWEQHLERLFPTLVRSAPTPPDVTLIGWGGMVPLLEEAAARLATDEELAVEIVLPSRLAPLSRATLEHHLAGRERIVIVEEGPKSFGVGAELTALLVEGGCRGRIGRVGAPSLPVPAAREMEAALLPGVAAILAAAARLF
ncbi:MAG: 2-oxoglutarate dehydrogenase, partial [Magnetococcales bacterium]|nr:2-oxoglutarate dehydrogenase [Magnetococcales bacterium]